MDLSNGVNADQQKYLGKQFEKTLKPTEAQAEAAVRVLLEYIGEDPLREGLQETPARVVRAWSEYCVGYSSDPVTILKKTFENPEEYSEPVVLRDISFVSHCEHHLAPINGFADIAYIPSKRVVGISKIARVVECFARRLQTQETMTAQIANCIQDNLMPAGTAVRTRATHACMTNRGVCKSGTLMTATAFKGEFENNSAIKAQFLSGQI
jgi:GTP cyclohydrolase I